MVHPMPRNSKYKSLSIQLTQELADRLINWCEYSDLSMSSVVRRALREHLDAVAPEPSTPNRVVLNTSEHSPAPRKRVAKDPARHNPTRPPAEPAVTRSTKPRNRTVPGVGAKTIEDVQKKYPNSSIHRGSEG